MDIWSCTILIVIGMIGLVIAWLCLHYHSEHRRHENEVARLHAQMWFRQQARFLDHQRRAS